MKTIYIHIGLGKTGTSAIQSFPAFNRASLLSRGVHYIATDGGAMGTGHQNFAKSFIAELPKKVTPAFRPEK